MFSQDIIIIIFFFMCSGIYFITNTESQQITSLRVELFKKDCVAELKYITLFIQNIINTNFIRLYIALVGYHFSLCFGFLNKQKRNFNVL